MNSVSCIKRGELIYIKPFGICAYAWPYNTRDPLDYIQLKPDNLYPAIFFRVDDKCLQRCNREIAIYYKDSMYFLMLDDTFSIVTPEMKTYEK